MMMNCSRKNQVKRSCHSGDILYKKIKQFDRQEAFWGKNSRARLLNDFKCRDQFAVSIDTQPYTKNQHHGSI